MKSVPEELLNWQKKSFLEGNIVNYVAKNITQPTDIFIENQWIKEEDGQYNTSVTNDANGESYDDCITQYSRKTQDTEIVEVSPLKEDENPLAVFHSTLLEKSVNSETPTIGELEESIVIAPGEGKKPISILNDIYCEKWSTHNNFQLVDLVTRVREMFHWHQVNS